MAVLSFQALTELDLCRLSKTEWFDGENIQKESASQLAHAQTQQLSPKCPTVKKSFSATGNIGLPSDNPDIELPVRCKDGPR